MGIGSASLLAGEICNFVGTGEYFASLYLHNDGAKISAETEISQGCNKNVSFMG